jgi:hypothetical protein
LNHIPVKVNWLERAIQVYNFHISQIREEPKWTVARTADALNRSIGSVSQDLLLASWSRTHEKQLKRFASMKDALVFVREKEREMRTAEL